MRLVYSGPTVDVVLPNDIDDPTNPSGGNVYDRRVCLGLAAQGWTVREHPVAGSWPCPSPSARDGLARVLAAIHDRAFVLIDGLVASAVPEVLAPHARRLHLVVLLHMPLGDAAEAGALALASAIITPSEGCRRRLLALYPLPSRRVHVVPPGVDPAPAAVGTPTGTRLLCVAAVTVHKGHDVLVEALTSLRDRDWCCECVGPLHREPEFVAVLRDRLTRHGIAERVTLTGPLTGSALADRYAAADLLVLPSRSETYGMVVTEALARGVPVLATASPDAPVVTEALGRAPDGRRPGLLVTPDNPVALAGALGRWLGDAALRDRLRSAARARRVDLADQADWMITSAGVARVLWGITADVSAER